MLSAAASSAHSLPRLLRATLSIRQSLSSRASTPTTTRRITHRANKHLRSSRSSSTTIVAMATALPRVPLGSSGVMVTEVCLGTMTWGVQNTEEEAHAQLDYAVKERGAGPHFSAQSVEEPFCAGVLLFCHN
jgi:hypothetical protein